MNHSTEHWQPTASMAVLRQRAKMLAVARSFFARLDMLEVETPVLSVNGVTDPHLSQLSCRLKSRGNDSFYLQTSPEYYMKRLLAAGSSDIFQICRVFRDRELGARHQPEFTMIEWYRLKKTLHQMIDETCAFITAIGMSMDFSVGTVTRHSYQAAFEAITGLDPLPAECAELSQCAERLLPNALSPSLIRQLGTDRNAWLDLLMSHHVIPALATDGLVVIDHYPAEQAALAKLNPKDERVAERFEIFFQGLELANGYRELLDPIELRERFEKDRCQRATIGAEEVQPDPALLAAMEQGLPDCCGVAVGFDRLVMSFCKLDTIDKAVSFAL